MPFLDRVHNTARHAVQEEWFVVEALKTEATSSGWATARLDAAIADAKLTVKTLARRLDGITPATLRREMSQLAAPSPSTIIRLARVSLGEHLLVCTRMPVCEVGIRAGYTSEKSFALAFHKQTGCPPSIYRRRHRHGHAAAGYDSRAHGP